MGWLAHMVGGPLHGWVDATQHYWPLVSKEYEGSTILYRLVCWVQAGGTIAPFTPLVYVWSGMSDTEAADAVKAYLALHQDLGGLLTESIALTTQLGLHAKEL